MHVVVEFLLGPQDGRTYDSRSRLAFEREYALLVWDVTKRGSVGEAIIGFNPDLVEVLLLTAGSRRLPKFHRHRYVVVDRFPDGGSTHIVLLYACATLPQEASA